MKLYVMMVVLLIGVVGYLIVEILHKRKVSIGLLSFGYTLTAYYVGREAADLHIYRRQLRYTV